MKIELDKKEYEKVMSDSRQQGYKAGYLEASTFVMCKEGKISGDLHVVCKSSLPYCPTCEVKKQQPNLLEEKKLEIRDNIQKIIDKKFPKDNNQRYKANALFSEIVLYLESLTNKDKVKTLSTEITSTNTIN